MLILKDFKISPWQFKNPKNDMPWVYTPNTQCISEAEQKLVRMVFSAGVRRLSVH